MDEVDAGLADLLATLPWTRFATVLEATPASAWGPYEARAQEEQSAARRFVGVGRANDHGIATLIARGTALDVQTFLAAVQRIAEVLESEGDTDPVDVRRSRAVGILGQPARALVLLSRHRDDADPFGDAEPPERAPDDRGRRSLDLGALDGRDAASLSALAAAGPRVQLYVHLTDHGTHRHRPVARSPVSRASVRSRR